MTRIGLPDDIWQRIEVMLPHEQVPRGRPARPNRPVLEAIVWILRTGAPWRDLPDNSPPWQTVYRRFRKWAVIGVWEKILAEVSSVYDQGAVMLDSTVVRAHQHAAGAKGGRKNRLWADLAADFRRKRMPWSMELESLSNSF